MPTAAELLAKTSSVDKTLVIDNDLRTIKIPSSVTNLGVENDDEVLQLKFRMPRYLGKTDLSTFAIRINYMNARGEGDVYSVSDMEIVGDNITFSWLVGPNATAYKGNTKFNVCMKIVDDEGYIQKEYNTTIATLPVLEGLETEEGLVEFYSDILEQWKNQLFGIGDTEEANLTAKSAEEQENIVQKGIEVLATIPEDYQTTYEMANNAYRTRANAIVSTEQGELVNLTDSSGDPLRGLRVFGKTSQVTTTGAQLLDFDPNVRFDATESYAHVAVSQAPFSKGGTYYYSCSGTIGSSYKMWAYDSSENLILNIPANQSFTLTDEEATSIVKVSIVIQGTTPDTTYIGCVYPMINEGESALPYEPYSGTIASPSPEWPQTLTSIGDNGEVDLRITTGNLFDKDVHLFVDATTIDKNTGEIATTTANGWRTFETLLMVQPNTSYVISGDVVPASWTCTIAFYDVDERYIGYAKVVNNDGGNILKFTTPDKAVYLRFNAHLSALNIDTVLLNSGTSVIDYQAGLTQSMLVDTPSGIPGIPVTQNGSYTDSNGQQWICDEIDFERGVYVQRVLAKTLTGSGEVWKDGTTSTDAKHYVYLADASVSIGSDSICSHAIYGSNGDWNAGYYWMSGTKLFQVYTDMSVNEWAAYLADQLDSGNPVELMCPLLTPIETELTAEELVAFGALHTNYPNTTILNDSGATMELKYNADTKIWIGKIIDAYVGEGSSGAGGIMVDEVTGDVYTLKVRNGKLMMDIV